MTTKSNPARVEREARLRWVGLGQMKVNPTAQRDLNQNRVDRLVASFDLEQMGAPILSHRDGSYWVIDGQHRLEALRQVGFTTEKVECWVYENLTEEDEAEKFLKYNDVLAVHAMPKFHAAITAGREAEVAINRIVRTNGLVVTHDKVPGGIGAVGTLRRIFARSDGKTLDRTLKIVHTAYGDSGLEGPVLDGIGLLCQRYNGDLNDEAAIAKLAGAAGGVNGLLGKAEVLRRQTGNYKAHCVAAAAVDIINSGKGGKKLPSWWKADA